MLRFAVLLLGALVLLAHAHARSADQVSVDENRVRKTFNDLLEQLREFILKGDPEKGIPVMDPLVVGQWKFNVSEKPYVAAGGRVSDVILQGLGTFVVESSNTSHSIVPPTTTHTFKLRLPSVSATGNYRFNGSVQIDSAEKDTIIDSEGRFTFTVHNTTIEVTVVVTMTGKVKSVGVSLDLEKISMDVQGAGEIGDIINKEVATRINTWFTDNRSDLEKRLAKIIKIIFKMSLV